MFVKSLNICTVRLYSPMRPKPTVPSKPDEILLRSRFMSKEKPCAPPKAQDILPHGHTLLSRYYFLYFYSFTASKQKHYNALPFCICEDNEKHPKKYHQCRQKVLFITKQFLIIYRKIYSYLLSLRLVAKIQYKQ